MDPLFQLHSDIDARVRAIRERRPDWPCGKGCDACCRRLAELPRLTEAEWVLLGQGLAALLPGRLLEIRAEVAAMGRRPARPIVCPLLDRASGACGVYAYRPVACRTYGFYVERGLGLYCPDLERRVGEGGLSDVVWGNQDAADRRLADLGEARALSEWLAEER